jgi:hypothetical protein
VSPSPVCRSGKLLLAFASTVILVSKSRETHYRILLSHESGCKHRHYSLPKLYSNQKFMCKKICSYLAVHNTYVQFWFIPCNFAQVVKLKCFVFERGAVWYSAWTPTVLTDALRGFVSLQVNAGRAQQIRPRLLPSKLVLIYDLPIVLRFDSV